MRALLACLLLAASPVSKAWADKLELPATITFDERFHHLYMYGHEIHSPATFTFDTVLVANGFRPNPIVEDTAKAESLCARTYKNVPFIQRLLAEGKSCREAGREYDAAVMKTVYRAMDEFRAARVSGDSSGAEGRAKALLDTSLIDVARTRIGDGRSDVVQRGIDVLLIIDPGPFPTRTVTPQENEADRRTYAVQQVADIQLSMTYQDQTLVMIGGPKGGVGSYQRGTGAINALEEIRRSVEHGVPEGRVVPRLILKEIIAHNPRQ
jgi:hypothetical protein